VKINKKIAAVSIASAALAGVGITAGAALGAQAASAQPAAQAAPHRAPASKISHLTVKASSGTHGKKAEAAQRQAEQWVTVQAGDTLSGIAAAEHMSWQALYATPPNPRLLQGSTVLQVGERLRIPADPKLRAAQFAAKDAAALNQESAGTSQSAAQAPPGVSQQSVTGGESFFEQCVAWRESSDTPTDPDGLFGILPSTWASLGYSGTAGQASVAQQQVAFNRLYAEYGVQPWAPSDGC
jgi:LysM repeat protein